MALRRTIQRVASRNSIATSADPAAAVEDRELKARQRAIWALGDYHKFATESIWGFGPELVAACGIAAGQRVLDVAAGSGNVALRAAEAGAQVVASDLTPENFEAGRREARARGVELDWVEADAEALPFGDGEFDVVTSAAGAIFAPRHQTVADELLRVCRPGGTIGMIAIVPSGFVVDLFEIMQRYSRSALFGSMSPLLWGREEHVRAMFGDRVASLELRRERVVLNRFGDPAEFRDYFKANHPVVVALYRGLAGEPARVAALDRDLMEAARRGMRGGVEGPTADDTELLLIVARKRG
jgi:2-polyprenyl-3-methyl-5-hydroxy-6-metoxy-1,4-benzoquinol methylase